MVLFDRNGQPIDVAERQQELADLYRVDVSEAADDIAAMRPTPPPTGDAEAAAAAMRSASKVIAEKSDAFADMILSYAKESLVEWSEAAGKENVLGRLGRRLSRRKHAKTLLGLEQALQEHEETLYLKREVSLASSADLFWSRLGDKVRGKEPRVSMDGVAKELDEGLRRDALRAILAMQRAPGVLRTELVRQRLAKLQPELRILGLHHARRATLTEAQVRAARTAKAKALHPDVVHGRKAAAAGRGRLFGGLLRWGGAEEDGDSAARADESARMAELNAAYEAVKEAVTAPFAFSDLSSE